MKYFSQSHWTTHPSNQLQTAFRDFKKEISKRIINPGVDLEVFKNKIELKISELNAHYIRCTPLKYRWHKEVIDRHQEWKLYVNDYHMPDITIIAGREEGDI